MSTYNTVEDRVLDLVNVNCTPLQKGQSSLRDLRRQLSEELNSQRKLDLGKKIDATYWANLNNGV